MSFARIASTLAMFVATVGHAGAESPSGTKAMDFAEVVGKQLRVGKTPIDLPAFPMTLSELAERCPGERGKSLGDAWQNLKSQRARLHESIMRCRRIFAGKPLETWGLVKGVQKAEWPHCRGVVQLRDSVLILKSVAANEYFPVKLDNPLVVGEDDYRVNGGRLQCFEPISKAALDELVAKGKARASAVLTR